MHLYEIRESILPTPPFPQTLAEPRNHPKPLHCSWHIALRAGNVAVAQGNQLPAARPHFTCNLLAMKTAHSYYQEAVSYKKITVPGPVLLGIIAATIWRTHHVWVVH